MEITQALSRILEGESVADVVLTLLERGSAVSLTTPLSRAWSGEMAKRAKKIKSVGSAAVKVAKSGRPQPKVMSGVSKILRGRDRFAAMSGR
jgi:hypothetical protein